MKKKTKFVLRKLLQTEAIILSITIVVIFLIVILRNRLTNKVAKDEPTKPVASIEREEENILVVNLSKPEIESKITDWNLILVNKENEIPEGYSYELKTVEGKHKVDARILEPLTKMLAEARKQGLNPMICSSYRTLNTQTALFNQKVKQYKRLGYEDGTAQKEASYWVTLPKTSEHEIGLAVDIVSASYQVLNEKQETTAVQKWLIEHCVDYGFVLRYPTKKKDTTKINYEPWHYRYVGIENAKFMKEKDLCLEEFIEYLKKD